MDATELNINFQKHICYSEKAKDIRIMEALGYDIELTYVKREESK